MKDLVAGTIILIVLFGLLSRIVVERDYKIKEIQVEDIVYTYTQVASKKGMLTTSMYKEMSKKLGVMGAFYINIKAEKFFKDSEIPLEIEGEKTIVGVDLRNEGFDILTITAIAKSNHVLNVFYNTNRVIYKLNGRASAPVF
ncbi:MAG TPA: hypothetical protein DCP90_03840 [Clostridiales bacterium]|nr:MAG: hypothetical protein A2Y22_03985 [Clostridiales bacterium GWD2_32_59]HAN09727.1 hypothetical protein [Clostridiales bacterium]